MDTTEQREPLTSLVVNCPWYVEIPRKKGAKKVTLNLNTYRNLHHTTNNKAKVIFTELMEEQLENVVLKTPVEVEVQVWKPTRRILDKGNVYAVSSKYLYDAMSTYGCWEDDNDNFVKEEVIKPTQLDPDKKGKIVFTFRSI